MEGIKRIAALVHRNEKGGTYLSHQFLLINTNLEYQDEVTPHMMDRVRQSDIIPTIGKSMESVRACEYEVLVAGTRLFSTLALDCT